MSDAAISRNYVNAMKLKQLICFIALTLVPPFAFSQGAGFTYQGRLTVNSSPATGTYDLQLILRDALSGGRSLATNQIAPVSVSNGLFTVTLDFGGDVFDGSSRWLQIGVRSNGSAVAYAPVSPAQPVTPSPYAIHAADSPPPGSVMAYMGTNAPSGWLLCDGLEASRTTYARLFAVIGTSNGSGDGVTTFNLPDLRGTFLRGLDGTAGVDPDKATRTAAKPGGNTGNALGSLQTDQLRSHNHVNGSFNRLLQVSNGTNTTTPGTDVTPSEPDIIDSQPIIPAGGNETRPRKIYVNYL